MVRVIFILIVLLHSICLPAKSKMKVGMTSDYILKMISDYHSSAVKEMNDSVDSYILTKYNINVEKRNALLKIMPTLNPLSRGKRNYTGSSILKALWVNGELNNISYLSIQGTSPNEKATIPLLKKIIVPRIYDVTVFNGYILSPCNKHNRRLYKYSYKNIGSKLIEMKFSPKVRNAQLVSGTAIIAKSNGKILKVKIEGDIDMLKFRAEIKMKDGNNIAPDEIGINTRFSFIGNRINSNLKIFHSEDTAAIDSLRNEVTAAKDSIWSSGDSVMSNRATGVSLKSKSFIDATSDYFIEKIQGSFGGNSRGSYSISPIVNPLYLGYSSKRGLTYKLKLNASYSFTDNTKLSLTTRFGYSFKKKQIYLNIPLMFRIGKHFSAETEYDIGNHITNSEILNHIKNETFDSINWDKMNLQYFKNMHWRFRINVGIGKHVTVSTGLVYYKRTAVDKSSFITSGRPTHYYTFAPTLRLKLMPLKEQNAVITFDYERGIKGVMKSGASYERFETDFSWKKNLYAMRSLSLRTGYGQYTTRSKNSYFLDYTNFKYENMPGGWSDDWTGEFQLLESNWYNASKYYVRNNITYESPLLVLSRIPFFGRYIEMERIYTNLLFTDKLLPYIEYGYGFTNKFFSAGIFCATSSKKFEGVGFRFGLELFRDW